MEEKPGSTRIIAIVDEGKKVVAGDVVCELDSSAFRDELRAQKIRWAQAKAVVEQVKSILEVNEITLREYRDGIYPQDRQLILQYISTKKTDEERAKKNLVWSEETLKKGYRASSQVTADRLALQQAEIGLREAEGMTIRLEEYTKKRLIKNLEAKIEAIKADKLAQESSFQLEDERMRRLERMIENCVLKAPRDGIVVYASQANPWGMVQNQIQQGVTVREGQTIINLPDPKNMRVRAKINESKVAMIQKGQKAKIIIDAFPDRALEGIVGEVTPIPAPANGPISDVRVYYAMVDITSGSFDEIRPGLSAEVLFLMADHRKVTRVPLQGVRWVKGNAFAAVSTLKAGPRKSAWAWRRIELGQIDPSFAEVISGLKPGDRVIARPDLLPAPGGKEGALEAVASVADGARG